MANRSMAEWPAAARQQVAEAWPGAMLPGRVQGWPRGTQRAASPAERLLSQAEGWWDAAFYREGDRFLRNQGTAGELLDLQFGSSLAPNSNDPLPIRPDDVAFAYIPNGAGNALSVPHQAGAYIGDTVEFGVDCAADVWNYGTFAGFLAKGSSTTAGTHSWLLATNDSSRIYASVSDGSSIVLAQWSVLGSAPFTTNRRRLRLKVKYVRNTGAGQNAMSLWFTEDFSSWTGATWTQLGSTITGASIGATLDVNTPVTVGTNRLASGGVPGKYYGAWVSVNDATVLEIDCDASTDPSATSFLAATGQTAHLNRATSGRKTVLMLGRGRGGRACVLFGADDYFEPPNQRLLQFQDSNGTRDPAPEYTWLVAGRPWATASMMGTGDGGQITPASYGIQLGNNSGAAAARPRGAAGITGMIAGGSVALGSLGVYGLVTQPIGQGAYAYTVYGNGVPGARTVGAVGVAGPPSGDVPFRIGRNTTGWDFEFTAAAVKRGAWSAAEIAAITAYYQQRGF